MRGLQLGPFLWNPSAADKILVNPCFPQEGADRDDLMRIMFKLVGLWCCHERIIECRVLVAKVGRLFTMQLVT